MIKYNPHFKYSNSLINDRSLGSMMENSSIIIDAEELISQIQPDNLFEIGTRKGIILFQQFIKSFAREGIKYEVKFQNDKNFSKFFASYLQIEEIFPNLIKKFSSNMPIDDFSKMIVNESVQENRKPYDDQQIVQKEQIFKQNVESHIKQQQIQQEKKQEKKQEQRAVDQRADLDQSITSEPSTTLSKVAVESAPDFLRQNYSIRSEPSTTLSKVAVESAPDFLRQSQINDSVNQSESSGYLSSGGASNSNDYYLADSFKVSIAQSEVNQQKFNNSEMLIQEQQSIFNDPEKQPEQPQQQIQVQQPQQKPENTIKIKVVDYVLDINQCPQLPHAQYINYSERLVKQLSQCRLYFKKPILKPEFTKKFLQMTDSKSEDDILYKLKQKFFLVTQYRKFQEFSNDLVYYKYEEQALKHFSQDEKKELIFIQFRGLKDTKVKWVGSNHEMFRFKEGNLAYPEIIIEHIQSGL